jgi:hypothetical protein
MQIQRNDTALSIVTQNLEDVKADMDFVERNFLREKGE